MGKKPSKWDHPITMSTQQFHYMRVLEYDMGCACKAGNTATYELLQGKIEELMESIYKYSEENYENWNKYSSPIPWELKCSAK